MATDGLARKGRDPLDRWRERPAAAGVLTDFDGTLAPIMEEPEAARPLPGVALTLARLAGVYGLVAVVSGRPVSFLADRLGDPEGVVLAGLYGLERWRAGVIETLPVARAWRPVVAQVVAAAETQVPPGVYIEPKGLSVVLHVRPAPEYAAWVEDWAGEQARRSGLVAREGKMSWELLPPVPMDKGEVVAELAGGLDAACFVGVDAGDLPAFSALAQLRAVGLTTLAVAVRSPECPPALLSAADMVVDGPAGALAFLRSLAPARPAPS